MLRYHIRRLALHFQAVILIFASLREHQKSYSSPLQARIQHLNMTLTQEQRTQLTTTMTRIQEIIDTIRTQGLLKNGPAEGEIAAIFVVGMLEGFQFNPAITDMLAGEAHSQTSENIEEALRFSQQVKDRAEYLLRMLQETR